jgi:DNA repair protein RecO (recombination protein O)
MQWQEQAFILSFRPHAEHDAVVSVFTRAEGRFNGLVKGGQSSKHRNNWQPGHLVNATWRARLMDHLGFLTGESVKDYAGGLLHAPLGLSALLSALALMDGCTAERMPYPILFDALAELLPLDEETDDLARYIYFECALLKALGYGLDVSACALTASTRDLAFVSPKTGRAVNRDAAAPWVDRLLPLPAFMTGNALPDWDDVANGLSLTGYFIERNLFSHLGPVMQKKLVERRQRLVDLVEKRRNVAATAVA